MTETELVAAIRNGDEAAFADLVRSLHGTLLHIALMYVPTRAVAEEVLQETWIAVLRGIHQFEGRSSLKTWIIRILMNRARTIGVKEHRAIPFSSAVSLGNDPYEGAADADRFLPADHPFYPMHWATPPSVWAGTPEERLLADEVRAVVEKAAELLSDAQREVLLMRDLAELSAEEVCSLLSITGGNQRVLLHRARAKVRRELEQYLAAEG
jgi:RNA polymerase sigma-70 factor (ECF subfamily)